MSLLKVIKVVFAIVVFAVPAVFHAIAINYPNISVPETSAQHAGFIFINLWFLYAFLKPAPDWQLHSSLAALTIHQFVVHGQMLYIAARDGRFDVQSASALVGVVATWGFIVFEESRAKNE